jgi:hypothetical protein
MFRESSWPGFPGHPDDRGHGALVNEIAGDKPGDDVHGRVAYA